MKYLANKEFNDEKRNKTGISYKIFKIQYDNKNFTYFNTLD